MVTLVNRAKMTTATTGTGTITLGSAVSGYQTFAAAGVANTNVVRYVIEDGANWEIGSGTYTSSGTTLTRTPTESSSGGAAITLTGAASVFITAVVSDLVPYVTGTPIAVTYGGTGATTGAGGFANMLGFTSTATTAATTTLTNISTQYQLFTGSTTQTVALPVTSTLTTGWTFHIVNNSTGSLTVNASSGALVCTVIAGMTAMVTCINIGVTDATAWEFGFTDFGSVTGTGAVVLGTGPTITSGVYSGTVGASNPSTGAFTTVTATSTVSDSAGNVRDLVNNAKTSAYVLALTDNGEMISITTGGVTVNSGIFSAGNNVTIYNNSASSQTVTQGAGVTLRLAGSATTGNRTLALRGICTIVCVASNEFVVSGAGLT